MLKIGINSFLTLEEAEDIVATELYPSSDEVKLWESLDDISKENICKLGTMAINQFNYVGQRDTSKYNLKFPRYIRGVEVVPREIKIAAVVNGLMDRLVKNTQEYKLINKGVTKIKVVDSSADLDNKRFNGIVVYNEALIYINHLIVRRVNT